VRNVNLEREKLELAVVENIQREDLGPIEKARALSRLQEEFRLTQREIASRIGKSREVVANTVRLLDLPPYVQEALDKGQITESHGRFLLAIENPAAQRKLFDDIVVNSLTTRELKNRVQAAKPRSAREEEPLSPELKMIEERLSSELGTPVKIQRDGGTGKIVIVFYSEEELENIVNKIGREPGEYR
jgi:ParB family chromosome partitioning protein